MPPAWRARARSRKAIDQPRHPSRARHHVVDQSGPALRHIRLPQAPGGHQHGVQRVAQIVTQNSHEPLLKGRLVTKRLLESLPASDVPVHREQHRSQDQQPSERRDIDPERGVEVTSGLDGPPFEATVLQGAHFGDQLPHALHSNSGVVRANDVQGQRDLDTLVQLQRRAQLEQLLIREALQLAHVLELHGIIHRQAPQVSQPRRERARGELVCLPVLGAARQQEVACSGLRIKQFGANGSDQSLHLLRAIDRIAAGDDSADREQVGHEQRQQDRSRQNRYKRSGEACSPLSFYRHGACHRRRPRWIP